MKAFLNASEIAKLLRVNRSTVVRWLEKGLIKGAMRPSGRHQWRIPLESYDKFIKGGRP
jgi:excisionase family DNA binding protein